MRNCVGSECGVTVA